MILLVCLLIVGAFAESIEGSEDDRLDVIDMSWRLKQNESLYHPLLPITYKKQILMKSNKILDHGVWVEVHAFEMAIHVGTHMDAPCHFCEDSKCWRMHEIPFEKLRGPAVVIDISKQCAANSQYEVTVADLEKWIEQNGPIPEGAYVMFNTGQQDRASSMNRYYGSVPSDISTWDFPGIGEEAVQFLLKNTQFTGIGFDWSIIDSSIAAKSHDPKHYYRAHIELLTNNKLLFEYVANIEKLPPKGYTIYANPLKIYDSCGAPMRMIAIKDPPNDGMRIKVHVIVLFLAVIINLLLICV